MQRSELMKFSASRSRRIKAQRIANASTAQAVAAEASAHAATKSKLRNAEYAIRTAKEDGATAVLRSEHLHFFCKEVANSLGRALGDHLRPKLDAMNIPIRPQLRAMFDHPGPSRFDSALIVDGCIPEFRYRTIVPNR